jgi:SAM-dependent methyltransferase
MRRADRRSAALSLRPTTNRFVPHAARSADERAVALLHLYAYNHAARRVHPGARVLDLGFGEGYGAPLLQAAGAQYRGLEVDPEMVEHAAAEYGAEVDVYDGTSIPTPDGAFDLVVAFQVIAYFEDPQPWLREIRRVLKPEGTALITTPNCVWRLDDGQRPWNRHHAREYTADAFREVLGASFSAVSVYGVFADEPIASVVKARGARARKLAKIDRLGLRYRLPESLDARVRGFLRRAAQDDVDTSGFTLERVRHQEDDVELSLDLLGEVHP